MKSVILSGYYGFGNIGDELLLQNIARLLTEAGFTDIYAVSGDVGYSEGKHPGVNFISRDDYRGIVDTVRFIDLVALGGGTLFQDFDRLETVAMFETPKWGVNSYINIPLIARIYGKPVAYLFQGAGPLFSEDARNFTRYAYSISDYISVRDRESEKLLRDLGFREIVLSGDPVLLYPVKGDRPKRDRPLVGISLRQWVDRSLEERIIGAFIDFLRSVEGALDFCFISFQDFDETNADSLVYEKIISGLGGKPDIALIRLKDYPLEEAEKVVAGLDFLIGMRLHAIILAVKYGVPFLALPYWNKVENLLKETGLEEFTMNLGVISGEGIRDGLYSLLRDTTGVRGKIKEGYALLHKRLDYGIESLKHFVRLTVEKKEDILPVKAPDEKAPLPGEWLNYKSYQDTLTRRFWKNRYGAYIIDGILRQGNYKDIIFYPSHMVWDLPLFQRPHQLFRVLSKMGYLIFFLTPDPAFDRAEPIREVQENLYLIKDIDMLFHLKDRDIIVWVEWTVNSVCRDLFPNSRVVYDWMDEIDIFYLYSKFMEFDHRKLLLTADYIFVTAEALLDEARLVRPDAVFIPNGASPEDFIVGSDVVPEDMGDIVKGGRPVIGFYGSIERWRMDYDLVNYLSGECGDLNFVFIGPSYDGSLENIKSGGNVFILGPKKYADLKYYLRLFDVAIIPYKVNRITDSVFPVKLCEYMAGGKPVVTTMMRECKKFKGVLVSEGYEDFVNNIRKALTLKGDAHYLGILREEASANTWSNRGEAIAGVLKATRPKKIMVDGGGDGYPAIVSEELEATQKLLSDSLFERQGLNHDLARITAEKNDLWGQLKQVRMEKDVIWAQLNRITTEKDVIWSQLNQTTTEKDVIWAQLNRITAEKDIIWSQLNQTMAERGRATDERDQAIAEKETIRRQMQEQLSKVTSEKDEFSRKLNGIYQSEFWQLSNKLMKIIDSSNLLRSAVKGIKKFRTGRIKGNTGHAMQDQNKGVKDSIADVSSEGFDCEFNPYRYLELFKDIEIDLVEKEYDADKVKIQFSLVTTVKNEGGSIIEFLKDIEGQALPPREVIIVDGGSTDATADVIEKFIRNTSLNIKFVKGNNLNIAQGRNIAIRESNNEIIVLVDAGCKLAGNICCNLVGVFEHEGEVDLVGGIYYPLGHAEFNGYFIPDWINLDVKKFLPSARAVAIKRSYALRAGGFPEHLTLTGEDTLFDMNYRRISDRWIINKAASVIWSAPRTTEEAALLAYKYCFGDGESGVGDIRFYEDMIRSRRGGEFRGDTIASECLRGYLEGRKKRGLIEINKRNIRGLALILSGVPFTDSGGGQRGTQLALEFMRNGYKVIYVNVYPSYEKEIKLYFDADMTLLELYHIRDFDTEEFIRRYEGILGKGIVIMEFPHPDFLPILDLIKGHSPKTRIIYDYIDNWDSSLGWIWYSKETEREIIDRSDILMASAATLREKLMSESQRDVALVANAVNTCVFDPSKDYAVPSDMDAEGPVVLYVGAMWGEWFDWDLVGHAARELESHLFVFIGSVPEEKVEDMSSRLRNVKFLGLKPQKDLPAYIKHSRVCIIPFKRDAITKHVNPLKVYEYLAMLKPVVAADMEELRDLPYTFLCDDYDSFVKNLREATAVKVDEDKVRDFIDRNNWQSRVHSIIEEAGQ